MNFSICIFKGFFAHFLGTVILRNVLNGCLSIKYKLKNMIHANYNIFIITIGDVKNEIKHLR